MKSKRKARKLRTWSVTFDDGEYTHHATITTPLKVEMDGFEYLQIGRTTLGFGHRIVELKELT